jgi:O-antigen ligase
MRVLRQTFRRALPRDAVTLITIFAVMRVVLPGCYVIGPLGGAGAPAQLIGLGIGLWWAAEWLAQPWPRSRIVQPLKRLLLAFVAAVMASYLVAAMRPISPEELLSADRALLNILAWAGVMMAAMDGITTRAGLDTLLRRVALLGGFEATFGLLQVLTGQTLVQYLHLPGLSGSGDGAQLLDRGGFSRVAGTTNHPIEFGVTLAMLLPIALHFAVVGGGRRSLFVRWFPVGSIALAIALTVSRSAIICTAVALPVLLSSWPPHLRRRVYLATPALIAALVVTMPGFLGTIVGLFTGIGTDSSAASRTGSYGLAWSFITRAPVFGRGMGTFLPKYRTLDNQYLGSLIELGLVGLTCILLLFLAGIITAWQFRRSPALPEGRSAAQSSLGCALTAGSLAGCVSFAFFDAWAFPLIPSMLFLMFGCAGALRRLTLEGDQPASAWGIASPPSVKDSPARADDTVQCHPLGGKTERLGDDD